MTSKNELSLEFRHTFFQSILESSNKLLLRARKVLLEQVHSESVLRQNKYRDIESQPEQ